jgi:hypothetical protein
MNQQRFAKWTFLIAGVYGLLATVPLYFNEVRMGEDYPPPINHPEYYYGFAGVVVAWAVLFLFLSRDPLRYRPMMIPAMLEKFSFPPAVFILYAQGRVHSLYIPLALIDFAFGVLFVISFFKTKETTPAPNLQVKR